MLRGHLSFPEHDAMSAPAVDLVVVALAGFLAGAVNALAGGGTLITFPALLAAGVPAVAANVTSTVALAPGYLGAAAAQSRDLAGQRARLRMLVPAGTLAGIGGGLLLLNTGEQTFRALVPYLILAAAGLLAAQDRVRAWVSRRAGPAERDSGAGPGTLLLVVLAGVYGGYFGAGLSVIVLAVLGLSLDDTLTRLNALKQMIAFAVNTAAAVLFLFSGHTVWRFAVVMAAGAVLGGVAGGRLAHRVRPAVLRRMVVVLGTVAGLYYLFR